MLDRHVQRVLRSGLMAVGRVLVRAKPAEVA